MSVDGIIVWSISKQLADLAQTNAEALKKRAQIARCLKKHDFVSIGKGAWLRRRNQEIVSGIIIEGSSSDVYLSSFILPSFDRHRFVSWSLGRRIICCSPSSNGHSECELAVDNYEDEIGKISTASELVNYLDEFDILGHYPIWVRYLCYVFDLNFSFALSYLDNEALSRLHSTQLERFKEIDPLVLMGDVSGVVGTLQSWSRTSEKIFGQLDQVLPKL